MFDVEAARKAGYSDTEIADYMGSKRGFDTAGARKAGYDDAALVKHLATKGAKETKDIWSMLPSGVTGAARGVKDVLDTGAGFLSRTFGSEEEARRITEMNRAGKAEFDARFGDSTAASIGRFGGNVLGTFPVGGALALPFKAASSALPVAGRVASALESGGLGAIPAATTRAGMAGNVALSLGSGAAVGGASSGLIDPESSGMGALLGASLPAVVKPVGLLAEKAGQLVKPFTARGRDDIASSVIRGAATNVDDVSQRLANPGKSISDPTFAEVADDPGVSGLLRHLQNKAPDFAGKYALKKDAQNSERFRFAYGLGGGEEGVNALKATRAKETDPLLERAMANAGDVGTNEIRVVADRIGDSGEMNRSAVRRAVTEAVRPFEVKTGEGVEWAGQLPFEHAWGARKNIDDMLYGSNPKVNDRAAEASAVQLGAIREQLSKALEKASPEFGEYNREFAKHSTKIDAAQTLNDLVKSASRGQTDKMDYPLLSATQLAQALKRMRPDQAGKLDGDQMGALHQLVRELERSNRSETLGKAVGSNTAQNMDFGLPGLTSSILRMSGAPSGGGLLSGLADRVTAGARDKTYNRIGDLMMDPLLAANAFRRPPPVRPSLLNRGLQSAFPLLPGPIAPSLSGNQRQLR